MITLGDIPLALPDSGAELVRWLDQFFALEFFAQFPKVRPLAAYDTDWPGGQSRSGFQPAAVQHWQPTLNSLYWPNGANQFACGLFLVTDSALEKIKAKAMPAVSQSEDPGDVVPLAFKAGDDTAESTTDTIEAQLYALPARAVSGISKQDAGQDSETLWLLPLVDVRYLWQFKSTGDLTATRAESWESFIRRLAALLGLDLTLVPTPSSDYLKPNIDEMRRKYDSVPAILDAALQSVGMRFVASLDGTFAANSIDAADTAMDDNEASSAFAGELANGIAGGHWNAHGALPAAVKVAFPKYSDHALYNEGQACVLEKDPPAYVKSAASGYYHTIHSSLCADFTPDEDGTKPAYPANCTQLDTLAGLIAQDYYDWHAVKFAYTFAGIKSWTLTGYEQAVCFEFGRPLADGSLVARTLVWTAADDAHPVRQHSAAEDLFLYNPRETVLLSDNVASDQTVGATVVRLNADHTDWETLETITVRGLGFGGEFAAGGTYHVASVEWDSEGVPYWSIETQSAVTSSTTTALPPVTDPVPVITACENRCKWTWSSGGSAWVLTENNCSTTTTTTADPGTTSTSTTTTASPCEACATTTTSTSTTASGSTSTTTTPHCDCTLPLYCGSVDGECTFTVCTDGTPNDPPTCQTTSTSTTTTCDCSTTTTSTTPDPSTSTTTTADPNACTGECVYLYHRVDTGVVGTQYISLYSNCESQGVGVSCECPPPDNITWSDKCFITRSPCITVYNTTSTSTTTTAGAGDSSGVACAGTCDWVWIQPPGQDPQWAICRDGCYSTLGGIHQYAGDGDCRCSPPTFDGSVLIGGPDEPMSPMVTPCIYYPPGGTSTSTSTTAMPCEEACYTTTSTSTTTTACYQYNPPTYFFACAYQCDATGSWYRIYPANAVPEGNDPAGCNCATTIDGRDLIDRNGDVTSCPPGTSCGTGSQTYCCDSEQPDCVTGRCKWTTDGVTWALATNTCPDSCQCAQPAYDPTDACETVTTPCGCSGCTTTSTTTTTTTTTTTSTTTSTSTTTTLGGNWYCCQSSGDPFCNPDNCDGYTLIGGPYMSPDCDSNCAPL